MASIPSIVSKCWRIVVCLTTFGRWEHEGLCEVNGQWCNVPPPCVSNQVMPIRQKKKEVEEDSNARLTHKDSPFPGKPSTVICEGTEMAVMRAENMLLKMLRVYLWAFESRPMSCDATQDHTVP